MSQTGPEINDPYTQVYNALIKMVRESHAVSIVVPRVESNVIDFNASLGLNERKEKLGGSDLPEIVIAQSLVTGNLNLTSDTIQVTRLYRFLTTSKAGPIGTTICPLEWAITCAMADANYDERLMGLLWYGHRFVKATSLGSVESGESDQSERGITAAWAAVWSLEVMMTFPRRSVQQFNKGLPVDQITS
jgi:hypothetical protein